MNIDDVRQALMHESLEIDNVAQDPYSQFNRWYDDAIKAEIPLVNAMTLATVSAGGQPSARVVLLKNVPSDGFVFFTNYKSRKGREITANPAAALLFHWVELERAVRIEGRVSRVSARESDDYFASRPLGSRYAAIASPQSKVISDRATLEERFLDSEKKYGPNPPRPPQWGGYRLAPEAMEFWQGRPNRLHDRVLYSAHARGWHITRLAP